MMNEILGELLRGFVGQVIYSGLILLALRWAFKVHVAYIEMLRINIILYLLFFAVGFVLAMGLGSIGTFDTILWGMIILGVIGFFVQAYVIATWVKSQNDVELTFGKALGAQFIILGIAIVIGGAIFLALM
jgi:hypothetical protein